jgi:hypothetical protein
VHTRAHFDDSGDRLVEEENIFREFYASVNFTPN